MGKVTICVELKRMGGWVERGLAGGGQGRWMVRSEKRRSKNQFESKVCLLYL